jgi:hypothetical protein
MTGEFYRNVAEVDKLIELGPNEEYVLEQFFGLISANRSLEDYSFKKLSESQIAPEWILSLKDYGSFDANKNPPPKEVKDQPGSYTIPFWNVLPFLEKVAEENKKNPRTDVTDALVEIVDDVINYRDAGGKRVENYHTDWFITKIIFKLPPERWKDDHIDFMRIAVKSQFGGDLVESAIGEIMLPALIKNDKKDLLLKLLSTTLDFEKTGKGGRKEIEPIVKKYWIKDALMKHTENITKLCGIEAARIGIGKIREINAIDTNLLSYLRIPTVERSSQIMFEDDYAYQLVAFVREILEKSRPEDVRALIEEILKDDSSILKRIAIHVINKRYDVIKNLFWEHQENLCEVANHEVYELLKAHCQELDKPEVDKVIAWSEEIKYPKRAGKEREMVEAWKRKELLTAILASENPEVIALYEKYDQIAPGKLDHAGLPVWHETGAVHDISPIEAAELQEMTNSEIAAYLRDYKQKDTWGLEQISEEGLRSEIEKCVCDNPQKFAEDMNAFLDVPTKYQYSIVIGFTKAWQAKKDFSVAQVLDFIENLIRSEKLWGKIVGESKKDAYEAWIISRITDLIEEGVRNDEHAFAEGCLPQIERLLDLLLEETPSYISDSSRVLDSILGSPRANVFSAVILYALRYARLYKKEDEIRWPESIKRNFTKYLDPSIEQPPDFILTVMRYLPNLIYLDKQWVFENIPRLLPLKETNRWKIAFEGYLTYTGHVYEELYSKLRAEGHYFQALNTDFGERDASEKLVQHIAIGFLEGWEDVEDPNSLISTLLKNRQKSQLSELVSFLGQVREGKPREKLEGRIKQIWGALYSILVKEQGNQEYQKVAAQLYSWLGLIQEIDEEIKDWMKLTAKYIHIHWYEYGLVEELARHVEKTPQYVGEIYIEMLNAGAYAYPDYKKEDTIKIVETLYQKGQKKLANTICNTYGEAGSYFLRDTYQKYNEGGS